MNPDEVELAEPISIANSYGRQYRFLFRGYYTEEAQAQALSFINYWAGSNGKDWKVVREKRRNIPHHVMFEITAWLN